MKKGKKVMIDDLTLLKSLGKGSYGEVFLTTKEGVAGLFATKKMDREYAERPQVSKYLKNEIAILKEMNHKNIVKLADVKVTKTNYYLVMEYCNGGSLSECLKKYQKKNDKPFSEEIVQHLMRQIIEGMKYVHNHNIIHRDLKLDNILVHFNSEKEKDSLNMMKAIIKIIDFGFATHIKKEDLCYSTLGSPINMDPAILKKYAEQRSGVDDGKKVGYDQKADIWSLGTLCYEMLIGKSAFDSNTMGELVEKVESGSYKIPANLSKEVVSFLNGMLQYNAKKRLTCNELARHHFLTKNVKDFEPIDVRKVSKKMQNNDLKVNIKRNKTIWSIFNEEDENKLINIPGNYLNPISQPIKEEEEFDESLGPENKRRNTERIPHIQKNDNFQNYPQDNNNPHQMEKRRNTQNYQGYGMGYNGIYEYQNTSNPNNIGYGYSNYPHQPSMPPIFPNRMPLVIPPSREIIESEKALNRKESSGPIIDIPTFGVPSPGEKPNDESGYAYSSGIFHPGESVDCEYTSNGGGYGYGYGYAFNSKK